MSGYIKAAAIRRHRELVKTAYQLPDPQQVTVGVEFAQERNVVLLRHEPREVDHIDASRISRHGGYKIVGRRAELPSPELVAFGVVFAHEGVPASGAGLAG